MKIAVFGGSFDPVHNDHVSLCNIMIERFNLDKVIVVPAFVSPFKSKGDTDEMHRYNMCKLAFNGIEKVFVSDFEIKRSVVSYTVDTLKYIKKEFEDSELYLIMGADAFLSLDKWHRYEDIFKLAHILAVVRDDNKIAQLSSKGDTFKCFGALYSLVETPVGDISSTEIRELIKANDSSYKNMLPCAVYKYIEDNKLYKNGN